MSHAISALNKNLQTYHNDPYFGNKITKTISVWVLYDTGAQYLLHQQLHISFTTAVSTTDASTKARSGMSRG
jgi:hypothetical protein